MLAFIKKMHSESDGNILVVDFNLFLLSHYDKLSYKIVMQIKHI